MEIGFLTTLRPEKGQRRYLNILSSHIGKLGENVTIIEPGLSVNIEKNENDSNVKIMPFNKLREDGKKFDIINFQLCNSNYHEFQIHFLKNLKDITSYIVTTMHDPRNIKMINLKCTECISFFFNNWLHYYSSSPFNIIDKTFQKESKYLIFHSKYMLKKYLQIYNCQNKAEVIPHIAYRNNKDILLKLMNEKERSINNLGTKRILVPGYISSHKGDDIIIKAVAKIKGEFKLIFMGEITDKNYYKYLLGLINKNKLMNKIEFLGHVSDDLFTEEMDRAYIVLNPRLITQWVKNTLQYKMRKIINLNYLADLPTSGVIVFALCSGKPIICSKNDGYFEYIGNERGILCEDNVESWKNAIQFMLENPDLVKKMSIQASKFADEELDPKKVAKKHIKVYKKVLENEGS